MEQKHLRAALTTLLVAVTCLALEDVNVDRDEIRRSILQYRARRSLERREEFSPRLRARRQAVFPTDDEEDFEASGHEDNVAPSEREPPPDVDITVPPVVDVKRTEYPQLASEWVWYRTKINFLDSIEYTEDLQDFHTDTFHSLSDKIMFGVEEYLSSVQPGYHEATPLMFTQRPNGYVDVLVDVGACSTNSAQDIEDAMRALLRMGQISDLAVSEEDFSMREVGRDPTREECLPAAQVATTTTVTTTTTTRASRPEPTPPDPDVDVSVRPSRPRRCNENEATCRNGQCIDRRRVCDGSRDCFDGSDEPPGCGESSACDPTEFLCAGTGICVQKMWRCDGDDDCGDGYDELGCPSALPGSRCRSIEFECVADSVCVPASYQCDGENDCSDSSDEAGCSRPLVVRPPRRNVTVKEGDTVVLHCKAIGVPAPIVSWRLNWGNVGAPPRVSMTSVNGSGELIIKQVRRSDQGAYTCETINSQGSIFAIPDAVLVVEDAGIDDQAPCPPGHYGMEEEACRPCYCFGVTDQCVPLQMEYDEIGITFETPDDIGYIELRPAEAEGGDPTPESEPINRNQILVKPAARELQLIDLSKRFLAAAHYWSLPAQFLGAKINSYGGTLTFSFSYNNSYNFEPKPTNYSDVIMEGANGKTLLYHRKGKHPEPTTKHTTNVALKEDVWVTPGGEPATREDLLGVLNNVDKLLLRTVYDNSMLSTGIGDVRMTVASPPSSGNAPTGVMAYDVEKCICPEGYEGLSCQYCAHGYERITVGPFVGRCEKIITDEKEPCPDGYAGDDCSNCADGYEKYGGVCREIGSYRCEPAGTAAPGVNGYCTCKPNVEGERCDECRDGFFLLAEDNPDGCTECFCMGITRSCSSSNRYRYKLVPRYTEGERFSLVNAWSTRRLQDVLEVRQTFGRNVVRADLSVQPRDVYYWVLPDVFAGDKVSSYGGNLRYTVEFNQRDGARPIASVDVKIIGNDVTLEYDGQVQPTPGAPTSYTVKFSEEYWTRPNRTPVSREHLLMVLADVKNILIRATYSTDMLDTSIYDISLEDSSIRDTGGRRAVEVEECACPPGYQGLSCETCAPGYHRANVGPYLGTCVRCSCNGHSDSCDEKTGQCLGCKHNTAGGRCDRCIAGFYGDARLGTPNDCRPCPCPVLPSRSDQPRIASCILDVDGLPTCDECPPGYEGRNCDRCSDGFEVDALKECRKVGTSCQCDPNGSVDGTCDSDGQCNCKESVEGLRCDVCKPSYFYFSVENTGGGCLPCFCMGVTKQCESSRYVRNTVKADFTENFGDFALTNRRRSQRITEGFQTRVRGTVLTRPRMTVLSDDTYYWELPGEFLGDKVVSYGGDLKYTVSYTPLSSGIPISDPDVVIVGNDITLVAYIDGDIPARTQIERSVTFTKSHWRRTDGQPATREHLLMALADLEFLLIKASYSTSMSETTIRDVTMETATANELDGSEFAYEVEQCTCPDGYEGLSCEDCSPGYTRYSGGYYLGLCQPCQCNGHSDTCDSETGECEDCRDNTAGPNCQMCALGFYTMSDDPTNMHCVECACPGTGENSFSDSCEFVASTRNLLCTACQEGYRGTRCEDCAEGYEGNPRVPGGKCVRRRTPHSAPIVTVSPSSLNVAEGSTATLTCEVNSTTPVQVTWRKIGSPDARLPPQDVRDRSGRDYSLTIRRFTRDDVGTYECVAQNDVGVGRDTGVLSLTQKPPMMEVRVEEPTTRRLSAGDRVTFVCTAQSEMNAYIIYWSKRDGRLPSRATDYNGILHITDLREEDSGTYVCTGSNMYEVDEKTATLVVVRDSNAVRPTVTIEPANQVVREGEEARFRCSATGTPPVRIEWRPSSGEAIPQKARIVGGELYIPSVSRDDSAIFYCVARNPKGFAEATAVLDVTAVGRPPSVTVVSSTRVFAKEGENVVMRCVATGIPEPLFSWRRLEQPGLPENVEQRGGTLQLVNVKIADRDTYVCTARNPFGEDYGTIFVNVSSEASVEKPICKTDPEFLTVYVGSDTSVTCVPQGDPLPTVTWVRSDGRPLPPNARMEGNKLFIKGVTLENAGKYMCIATNAGGTTRSEMTLKVEDKSLPEVEILPRNQQVVEVGQSASFTCRPTAGHPVEVTWSRTDRKPFTRRTTLEDGGVIRFTNVTQEDGGSYVCIARNVVGFREVATLLSVIRKPIIRIEPTADVYLRNGRSITLRCTADGIPVPNVAWQKLHIFGQGITLTHYRRHSNIIHIRADDIGSSAQYLCVARSAAGDARQKVTVTVGEKETVIAPEVTVEKSVVSKAIGGRVQLRCASTGYPAPHVEWSKRDRELPEDSHQENGVLTIGSVDAESAGNYVCVATNGGGRDSGDSTLKIIVPPKLRITPTGSVVYIPIGRSKVISCSAYEGTSPVTYEFRKAVGNISNNILTSGDRLQVLAFNPATDSGAYTCVGSNEAGHATAEVTLLPLEIPSVDVSPTEVAAYVGGRIDLFCRSTGDGVDLSWSRTDGELDADRSSVENGALRVDDARMSDAGEYRCSASNDAGTSSKTAYVLVQEPPAANLTLLTEPSEIRVGSRLELTCTATGVPPPLVTITKDGDEVLSFENGKLVIEAVTKSDDGTYACVATSDAGTAKDEVVVHVLDPLMLSIIPDSETLEMRSGEELAISCVVKGTTLPVAWTRTGEDLPPSAVVAGGLLQIDRVSVDNAGEYVCSSEAGDLQKTVKVIVHAYIPHFTQSPTSYLSLTGNEEFYRDLSITVSFRPNSADGLILYSYGSGGDYFSLVLIEGKVEFRFNVGSGDAVILSREKVALSEWHTVTVSRDGREGQLTVNKNEPVYGTSEGSFRALNLNQPLYVGGYPVGGDALPESLKFLGIDVGFYGCISQLIIGDANVDMGSSDLIVERVGILRCKTCGADDEDSPCQHGATCTESHSSSKGYICGCSEEYVGPECQFRQEDICGDLDVCGKYGSCIPDYERERGYRCECEPGYTGPKCQLEILDRFVEETPPIAPTGGETGDTTSSVDESLGIIDGGTEIPEAASFTKGSYMQLGVTHDNLKQFDVMMRVKVRSLDDGLILYNGGILGRRKRAISEGDIFVSVAMLNESLEFRYSCGSGLATLTSPARVIAAGQWHTIHANRANRKGVLKVDGVVVAEGQSPKGGRRAELDGPLFIGGVRFWDRIPDQVGVTAGLDGCIERVIVDGKHANLHAATASKNVESCVTEETTPVLVEPTTTRITTLEEEEEDISTLFLHSGMATGFSGSSAKFNGNSFISFPENTFPHSAVAEQFSLYFKTKDPDGLLFLHGRSGRDFILLGMRDARLEYMFQLGTSQGKASGSFPLADGRWHNVTILRRGSLALMWVDELLRPVAVQAQGQLPRTVALGDLFIGGAIDVPMSTGDRYRQGFRGCVRDVRITTLNGVDAGKIGATFLDDAKTPALQFGSDKGRKAAKGVSKCRPDRARTLGFN